MVVTYALPTATDNEDPSPDVTCTPASGTSFTLGQTQVTCTATDAKGNTSTKTFTVTVNGAQSVGGTVPATLALTLGAPAQFGAFTPGVAKELHGLDHRERHLDRRRRGADISDPSRPRPATW